MNHEMYRLCIQWSHIYNQKSEHIDFKGLAEVLNKLIFNNLHNPPPTKYFDIIINPLYSKQLLNLVLLEDCGGIYNS
jgi:beta-glucosidase/6-phospho-beta-glucosidase/beta-galactosidase